MKKSTILKKLSLNKLTISKLTSAHKVQGGSGICDPNPKSYFPNICPPAETCHKTRCDSCSDNANSVVVC